MTRDSHATRSWDGHSWSVQKPASAPSRAGASLGGGPLQHAAKLGGKLLRGGPVLCAELLGYDDPRHVLGETHGAMNLKLEVPAP